MPERIYWIDDTGSVQPLDSTDYDKEELLQKLVAEIPGVLAGGDAADDDWILIKREMAVPDASDSAGRWSLDHLFLDRRGVPTLVEVKRKGDPRGRREVVAQMLDYAANSVMYWSAELIREMYVRSCEDEKADPDERLLEFLHADDALAIDEFWQQVATNLEAENLRLVFLGDVIPKELRRIIEFLNGQMSPVEVLGIEVPQFVSDGTRVLVPSVVGRTMQAEQKKEANRSEARPKWDERTFFETVAQSLPGRQVEALQQLLDVSKTIARIRWGTGRVRGSFSPRIHGLDTRSAPFTVFSDGEVWFKLNWLEGGELSSRFAKALAERLCELAPALAVPLDEEKSLSPDDWIPLLPELSNALSQAFEAVARPD